MYTIYVNLVENTNTYCYTRMTYATLETIEQLEILRNKRTCRRRMEKSNEVYFDYDSYTVVKILTLHLADELRVFYTLTAGLDHPEIGTGHLVAPELLKLWQYENEHGISLRNIKSLLCEMVIMTKCDTTPFYVYSEARRVSKLVALSL